MEADESLDCKATPEEVCQAYEVLSGEDLYRLWKSAKYCLPGSDYSDPDEIIGEAICRTMSGERHWPKDVPFMAYMIQTMRGLASDSRRLQERKLTRQLEAIVPEGAGVDDVLGGLGHNQADALTNIIEVEMDQERQVHAKADLDKIEAHFSQDPEVTWIILGRKDELPPAEIRGIGNMTPKEYDTAMRRFRRGIERISPEKRAS